MFRRGFEPVIGLEIHVQLRTKSKMFSSDGTEFGAGDNENTSPVSVGLPGTLPVVNKVAIELAVKTGLALGCDISRVSRFSRKNYFYPDLPKGYQISQYDEPLCKNGHVPIKTGSGERRVRVLRAHVEEDAGKSSHSGEYTLINFNRAGVPLLEIVSEPDMNTAEEAAQYARTIWQMVRYLDVCDGNMEEGSLRCDVNVSIRRSGDPNLGTKVEIKNMNSFRFIEKAINYEIDRQIDMLERGDKVVQETRLFDPNKNKTFTMRTKEDAQDYRYFPDPDLLPIVISEELIHSLQEELPELPHAKANRFCSEYGLSENEAALIVSDRRLAEFFEQAGKNCGNYKSAANWVLTEVLKEWDLAHPEKSHCPIPPTHLGELISHIDKGEISGKMAKIIFAEMWKTGGRPLDIQKKLGLAQITNAEALEKIVDEILASNEKNVAEFRSGKTKVFSFFIGAVMKQTKGQASPELVNQILNKKLQKDPK